MSIPNRFGLGRTSRAAWHVRIATLALLLLALPALAATPPLEGVVNINSAGIEQLALLPGVGESRAQAIIELRKERGGFKSVDELMDVKGIGQTLLAKLKPFARISGKTTAIQP